MKRNRDIPMASLAAMLIAVGYRLASPKTFSHTFEIGKEQLLILLTTIIVTVSTDLLVGIGSGILMKFIIEIVNGTPLTSIFKSHVKITQKGDDYQFQWKPLTAEQGGPA